QVDPKEHIGQHVVLERDAGRQGADRGVLAVQVDAGVADHKAADGDVGGRDLDDVAAAVAVDDGPAASDQRDRLVDPQVLAVDAGADLDDGAGLGLGDAPADLAEAGGGRGALGG